MRRLLKFLLPKSVAVPEREARTMESTVAAPSPTPELDEQVREQRGIFAQEVVKLEKSASDIRLALGRKTLEFRTRPH